jgi:succinate dehydrogenase / fumarate reductase cytochrome b subunit
MTLFVRIWRSSLGKKYLMAISGAVLIAFVVGHLLGNLQIFLGADVLNRYGHFLQSNVELIWPARLGLVVLVILHIVAAVKLTAENRAARPMEYAGGGPPLAASYASRTMMMSGLIVAAFIIYHLLHFTVQVPNVNFAGRDFRSLFDGQQRHDVYAMMVFGFRQPLVSIFYIAAMGLLCLHLSHGVQAMFQSLGVLTHCCPGLPKFLAKGGALLIFVGYASIPLAVWLGLVGKGVH